MKIVTLTLNPALDKSTSTSHLVPEQKLRCTEFRMDAGGGGINVSKGIQKLGGESIAVFPSGGHNGRQIERLLNEMGIVTQTIAIDGETRENIAVTESSTNQQYRFTLPGVPISVDQANECLARIEALQPEILVASGSLPPGLPVTYFEHVAEFSKRINSKFVLDTSGAALTAAADEGLYLLKPNLGELSALIGAEKLEMHEVDDAALSIIRQGKCAVVVVSLGPQGALLVTEQEMKHVPAPTVKKRTTVGAGDSMVAGMVWALAEGLSPLAMTQLGVACGTAATLNEGTELFNRADVDRLLQWIRQYGERFAIRDF